MSLVLLQNATAMARNLTLPFSGSGGTAPYVYSVVGGGAGGSINSSTGLYTSPNVTGSDTIRVTDALSATATAPISIFGPIELVCDIIQNGLDLDNGQVYEWDQKINIPIDEKLYIAVGILACKPFGNTIEYDGDVSGFDAVQSTNFQATLSINIFSRGKEARDRKEEVIMALNSDYSEQQQELNSFRLFPISTDFVNISNVDGAAIPYAFNISVNIQYFVTKTNAISYYDIFAPAAVVTNP